MSKHSAAKNSRREFLHLAGAAGVVSALTLTSRVSLAGSSGRVAVVGGGFGGATAARYVKKFDPGIDVTLIEPNTKYVTCPFSNTVLGGMREINAITHSYKGLSRAGVKVLHDSVSAVDPVKKRLATKGGDSISYDRLIMSPGIDFRFEDIPGYDEAAMQLVPHAWKAGQQTVNLRRQLMAMDDGGLVIITSPNNPFRCPPGPYERASMIAYYLKHNKPRSKLLILDAKSKFSKMPLFLEGWGIHYKNIEWIAGNKGGQVIEVDAKNRVAITDFDKHKAAVFNFIPPQKAGAIAHSAGLTDKSGWCPVDFLTFESTIHKDIHVIGDAAIVTGMPKSGNAANSEAKACAIAVVALLKDNKPMVPMTSNTCYSLITPEHGISVTAVWTASPDGYKKNSGGVSPEGRDAAFRKLEATYARGWYANISRDIWG
jgi:sulfide dehydrogenase [flavocytochrome c] flavoprotein subunit